MTGPEEGAVGTEVFLEILMAVVALSGVVVAWLFYLRRPDFAAAVARNPAGRVLHDFWLGGCGFDWVYDRLFVRPFVWAARVNRGDFIDAFYRLLAALSRFGNLVLRQTETGNVRWYAAGMVIGAIITVTILVLL